MEKNVFYMFHVLYILKTSGQLVIKSHPVEFERYISRNLRPYVCPYILDQKCLLVCPSQDHFLPYVGVLGQTFGVLCVTL